MRNWQHMQQATCATGNKCNCQHVQLATLVTVHNCNWQHVQPTTRATGNMWNWKHVQLATRVSWLIRKDEDAVFFLVLLLGVQIEDGNLHIFYLFPLVATLNPVYFVALMRRSYSQMGTVISVNSGANILRKGRKLFPKATNKLFPKSDA